MKQTQGTEMLIMKPQIDYTDPVLSGNTRITSSHNASSAIMHIEMILSLMKNAESRR